MMKQKFAMLKAKAMTHPIATKAIVASSALACAIPTFAGEGESAGQSVAIDVSGVNFMSIFDCIKGLLPALLPVIVAFIGFRKGLEFLKSTLHGA